LINIVIPMAGAGSRFADAGYTLPKPLINVCGKTMIEVVCCNLRPSMAHKFIFICQEDHLRIHRLDKVLERVAPTCDIICIDKVTEGAACTVLLARSLIDNQHPLMIANCDQFIDINIDNYLAAFDTKAVDGMIMTMRATDEKWSFLRLDQRRQVAELKEKQVISNEATVGIYNFSKGSDFVSAADAMIAKNIRTNNEFYVAPVYNEMISNGKKIDIFNIGELGNGMHGLGTPSDLNAFLETVSAAKLSRDN
jgi:dTDP-glucose pyrophosphorylase